MQERQKAGKTYSFPLYSLHSICCTPFCNSSGVPADSTKRPCENSAVVVLFMEVARLQMKRKAIGTLEVTVRTEYFLEVAYGCLERGHEGGQEKGEGWGHL